ncbi:MAG: HAD family hydrolase, partial [Chitinophagaceae bacterium]|nr:HAD family hydrolase [Chitinophagaceae bacterium]
MLLSNSFTNSHVIRVFDRAGFYVRNAAVVERMVKVNHLVFDKTGTLTDGKQFDVEAKGDPITEELAWMLASVAAQTTHPLSRAVLQYLAAPPQHLTHVKEHAGRGVEAWINDCHVKFGSP